MTNKLKFPLWTIALDIVGTLLVAGGIYGLVADADPLFGGALDLKLLAIPFIVLGVLLMAPLVICVVKPRQ